MQQVFLNNYDNKYYIEDDIHIQINNIKETKPHTHDFIEFVYMLKGKSLHKIDGFEYPIGSGDLLIINYNQIHSFDGDPNAIYCNILIKPDIIDKRMKKCKDLFMLFDTPDYKQFKELINNDCRFIRFSPDEKNCFEYMLRLLNNELRGKKLGYDLTTISGINFLLTMIFRKMCNSLSPEKHEIAKIFEYINNNYEQNISITDLSAMCNYNPSYFSRFFKKCAGITFSEYLKKVRKENACRLIINDDLKISNVYTMVGYTNKTNFYKHFKEITGLTPYEYKKVKK